MDKFLIKIPHKTWIQENYNRYLIQLRFSNRPPAYVSMTSREQQQIRREERLMPTAFNFRPSISRCLQGFCRIQTENLPTSASHLCLQITSNGSLQRKYFKQFEMFVTQTSTSLLHHVLSGGQSPLLPWKRISKNLRSKTRSQKYKNYIIIKQM